MISAVFAAAVLLVQGAPAAATTAPGSAVSPVVVTGVNPAKPAATNPDELVCRSEPVLGTLFPKKICARREEFVERQRIDQAEVRKAQALRPWKDPAS